MVELLLLPNKFNRFNGIRIIKDFKPILYISMKLGIYFLKFSKSFTENVKTMERKFSKCLSRVFESLKTEPAGQGVGISQEFFSEIFLIKNEMLE